MTQTLAYKLDDQIVEHVPADFLSKLAFVRFILDCLHKGGYPDTKRVAQQVNDARNEK